MHNVSKKLEGSTKIDLIELLYLSKGTTISGINAFDMRKLFNNYTASNYHFTLSGGWHYLWKKMHRNSLKSPPALLLAGPSNNIIGGGWSRYTPAPPLQPPLGMRWIWFYKPITRLFPYSLDTNQKPLIKKHFKNAILSCLTAVFL